ncbi:DUF6570 domain-containing protein [Silvimonas sp.]|uniref:DUF6570 domain-containing protein n=1 Tax=Silvimonas sp. TaxID=2650811 RepID=UPI002847B865|nr:DUF6570 domain-containing protein [Silvimonas sp.]MDR3427743.1 hypothetical protein [Silvimonas sp.]
MKLRKAKADFETFMTESKVEVEVWRKSFKESEPLHLTPFGEFVGQHIQEQLSLLQVERCGECGEAMPNRSVQSNVSDRVGCKGRHKYGFDVMEAFPAALVGLSMMEQALISQVRTIVHIHTLSHGMAARRGGVLIVPQDVGTLAATLTLPRRISDSGCVIIREAGSKDPTQSYRTVVRAPVLAAALLFLKEHNALYADIVVDFEYLQRLADQRHLLAEFQRITVDVDAREPMAATAFDPLANEPLAGNAEGEARMLDLELERGNGEEVERLVVMLVRANVGVKRDLLQYVQQRRQTVEIRQAELDALTEAALRESAAAVPVPPPQPPRPPPPPVPPAPTGRGPALRAGDVTEDEDGRPQVYDRAGHPVLDGPRLDRLHPVQDWDARLWKLAFPCLFPFGTGAPSYAREPQEEGSKGSKYSVTQHIEHLIRTGVYVDGQYNQLVAPLGQEQDDAIAVGKAPAGQWWFPFGSHEVFVLMTHNIKARQRALSSANVYMKDMEKADRGCPTPEEMRELHKKRGTAGFLAMFQRYQIAPGNNPYWAGQKSGLQAMITQLESPSESAGGVGVPQCVVLMLIMIRRVWWHVQHYLRHSALQTITGPPSSDSSDDWAPQLTRMEMAGQIMQPVSVPCWKTLTLLRGTLWRCWRCGLSWCSSGCWGQRGTTSAWR